ncbi:hypothetical protein AB0K35_28205 [Micromonospora sp. NPDC053740]|uniref:hypothetical protein n=1 Tax=Micromonospora sp. NPDC053740 TaxID=3155173 RepID=UPI003427196A
MTETHLPESIRKARAEEAATYPPHVIYAGGIDHYQAGQSQGLHDAILRADWDAVRTIAADPYTAGDDVDMAAGALAGACEPAIDAVKTGPFDAAAAGRHLTNPDFTAAGFERHIIRPDVNGNLADRCGHCTLLPTVSGYVRATQSRCPVHGTPTHFGPSQTA